MLRRLGHINQEGVVLAKGRAACEIDTADELLTAELLLNGVFSQLDVPQTVALASCLISESDKSGVRLPSLKSLVLRQTILRSRIFRGDMAILVGRCPLILLMN